MNLKNLILKLTTIALMVFLFFGCASKIMVATSPVTSLDNEKALVTFTFRAFLSSQGLKPREFDIWDSEKFIGAISKGTYVQYQADPGEHIFIAIGGNTSFLKAVLAAGKEYSVDVNIYLGPPFKKQYVAFQPVKIRNLNQLSYIHRLLKRKQVMEIIPEEYDQYVKKRIPQIQYLIKEYENNEVKYVSLDERDGM